MRDLRCIFSIRSHVNRLLYLRWPPSSRWSLSLMSTVFSISMNCLGSLEELLTISYRWSSLLTSCRMNSTIRRLCSLIHPQEATLWCSSITYCDCIYKDGQLYAMSTTRELHTFDLSGPTVAMNTVGGAGGRERYTCMEYKKISKKYRYFKTYIFCRGMICTQEPYEFPKTHGTEIFFPHPRQSLTTTIDPQITLPGALRLSEENGHS